MRNCTTESSWLHKAALFELLSLGLRLPTPELAEALSSGAYTDALKELAELNGIAPDELSLALAELAAYAGTGVDVLFHELRTEYTHLYVGAPKPAVSPYAGIWWAREAGVEPLLFVNRESLAVERFMRSCGIGQPEGTNEPLDHIASELEFLQYLCLIRAGATLPPELPDDFSLPEAAFENFSATHFASWSKEFAEATIKEARAPFYRAVGRMLASLS
ncbi:MAG: molecular chaperone TorD family protein [Coriobacteriales bacterium]|jgi:TorA maturation chaperone TorD|nr:molecular chaperone TorD family protein [Coriobacteriales bacterium]